MVFRIIRIVYFERTDPPLKFIVWRTVSSGFARVWWSGLVIELSDDPGTRQFSRQIRMRRRKSTWGKVPPGLAMGKKILFPSRVTYAQDTHTHSAQSATRALGKVRIRQRSLGEKKMHVINYSPRGHALWIAAETSNFDRSIDVRWGFFVFGRTTFLLEGSES